MALKGKSQVEDETVEVEDEDANEALSAGFSEETNELTDKKPAAKAEEAAPDAEPDAQPPEKSRTKEVVVETDDDPITLTRGQFKRLMASVESTDSLNSRMEQVFGKIGNVQGIVEQLRRQTPSGVQVELPEGLTAKLEETFPELAGHMGEMFATFAKGIKGTAAPAAGLTEDGVKSIIAEAERNRELRALNQTYPDWPTIVGQVDVGQKEPDPNHPFRKWLKSKGQEYDLKIQSTNSPDVIRDAITLFRKETKQAAPAVAPAKRAPASAAPTPPAAGSKVQQRRSLAVQPKGDRSVGQRPTKPEDDFAAGFREG